MEKKSEIDLLDLAQILAENVRFIVIGSLFIGVSALLVSYLVRPVFTATTTLLPPQQQQSVASTVIQSLGAFAGLAGGAIKNQSAQYAAMIKSRTVAEAVIKKFDLMKRYETTYLEDAVKTLQQKLEVVLERDGLIRIEVDDHDARLSADLANAFVGELSNLLDKLAVTEAQQRRLFFQRELERAKENLVKSEKALRSANISEGEINVSPGTAVGAIASLTARVSAKEIQLRSMSGYLTDNAPEFRRAQSELIALREQLKKAESDTLRTEHSGEGYISRYRDFKYHETLFELMAKQYELARVDESREGAIVQVVDIAVEPKRKSRPKRALIAVVATLVSGFLISLYLLVVGLSRLSSSDVREGKIDRLLLTLRKACTVSINGSKKV